MPYWIGKLDPVWLHWEISNKVCLLFAVNFLSGSDGSHDIIQSPRNLTLAKGETAEIQCSYHSLFKAKVNWFKDGEKITADSKRTYIQCQNTLSTLVIHNLSSNDSGLYVCTVIIDIPKLYEYSGNGTQLTVDSHTERKIQIHYIPVPVFVS